MLTRMQARGGVTEKGDPRRMCSAALTGFAVLILSVPASICHASQRQGLPESAAGERSVAAMVPAPIPETPMYWRALQRLVPDGHGGTRFLSPAEVVALGGDVVAGGSFTGIPIDVPRTQQLRKEMLATRRLATQRGVDLRLYVTSRPDHYVELQGAKTVPGFSDDWIFRTPIERYREDLDRIESRGWSVEPGAFVSESFLARIRDSDPASAPHFYGPVEIEQRRYKINGVLVDLRNPDYRRWQLDWLESLLRFVGADGVAVPIKTGWHAYPMHYPKASPDGRYGGPLSDTPYAAGEYEAAVTSWVREASARGIRVFLQDSTPGAGGPGAWYPPELLEAIAGRFRPVPIPHDATLRDEAGANDE